MMKNKILPIGLLILGIGATTLAQQGEDLGRILQKTNREYLSALSQERGKTHQENLAKALAWAKQKGWLIRQETPYGFIELQGISDDNKPVYYITHNANAAATVSTNNVWRDGSAGLDLDGSGIIIGEWDQAAVRASHQEFTNTGITRVIQQDTPSSTSSHATHVAGTMIAAGIDPAAKGMASNATLHAWDWTSDSSEMAAAAADGLLLSNHSYGYVRGWYWNGTAWKWAGNAAISDQEDYMFGFYDTKAQTMDYIAANAPYYLIVNSAGNDRGSGAGEAEHPADGGADGYDCISHAGVAKNVLTVGAVFDLPDQHNDPEEVQMSLCSNWGPTDDGRIKPDICGNGSGLYSALASLDDSYAEISGTSMAAPNVTGSLALLQEHYNTLHGGYMKAATLKAVALHSADEAGPHPGPDYMFGWGLMNTEAAAQIISGKDISSLIKEENYSGSRQNFVVTATGAEPLIVTLVWTDPPGIPVAAQLDPSDIMLVNDLDISISKGEDIWYPYKLDRENPAEPASTGNNDVDNVEKIVIDAPAAGKYTVTLSHEGVISNGTQDFSMIVSGIAVQDDQEKCAICHVLPLLLK